jgi:hypothetical protein
MRRSRFGCAVLSAAAFAIGCGVPQERSVLDRFFTASRLRDTTALSEFATVVFEPLQHGIITNFDILEVTPQSAGAAAAKDVAVSAPVKLPTGEVATRTLNVTLERRDGKWIVTGFRLMPAPGARTSPGGS